MTISKTLKLAAASIVVVMVVGLVACDKPGPAEKVGESIDNAAEKVGDTVDDAAKKLEKKDK